MGWLYFLIFKLGNSEFTATIIFFALIFFSSTLHTEELLSESKKIKLEKKGELSIFEEDVIITTAENNIIKSDYAEYDKKNGTIILKKNIRALDSKKNEIGGLSGKPIKDISTNLIKKFYK